MTANITLYAKWSISIPTSPAAVSATFTSVLVSWDPVIGAAGYEICMDTAKTGSYTWKTTAVNNTYTNTGLITGKPYYYKVRAFITDGGTMKYSGYTAIVSAIPVPAKPLVKLKKSGAAAIKVSWGKIAGTTKYEVYRSSSAANGFKIATATAAANYADKRLKKGKTYFYKVRSYCKVGKKMVYGLYSDVVSIKL